MGTSAERSFVKRGQRNWTVARGAVGSGGFSFLNESDCGIFRNARGKGVTAEQSPGEGERDAARAGTCGPRSRAGLTQPWILLQVFLKDLLPSEGA